MEHQPQTASSLRSQNLCGSIKCSASLPVTDRWREKKADFSLKGLPIAGCVIRQRADSSYSTPWHLFLFSRGCKSLAKVNATPEKKEVIQVIVHAQVSSRICVVCAGFSPEQWSIAIKQKKILFILNSRVV